MTKVKEVKQIEKKVVKKDLEGKVEYLNSTGNYQIRMMDNGTLIVYIKRSQKILVRLLPAMPKVNK